MTFPREIRSILHPFSDQTKISASLIPAYSLEEILAEKIRALAGQRRFAISRDVYDIHQLIRRGVGLSAVLPLLPLKFEAKRLHLEAWRIPDLEARRPQFESDWHRRLTYLVPRSEAVSFEDSWETVIQVMRVISK